MVISTLPAGGGGPAARGVDPTTVLLDVVYAPWPTPFAAAGAANGAAGCASGLDVLLHQAVDQVELMTGPARAHRGDAGGAHGGGRRAAAPDACQRAGTGGPVSPRCRSAPACAAPGRARSTGPATSGTARGGTVPDAR